MKILVTGSAGFIGYDLFNSLIKKNIKIIGADNINNYYSAKFTDINYGLLKLVNWSQKYLYKI